MFLIGLISLLGVGGVWVHLLEAQGFRVRVILVLRECILHAPVVPPVLPTFDVAGSLGFPPLNGLSLGFHPGNCLSFPCGEYRC